MDPIHIFKSGFWIFPLIMIVLFLIFSRSRFCKGGFFNKQHRRDKSLHNPESEQETPLSILKRRYARGEINSEEYSKMRKELE